VLSGLRVELFGTSDIYRFYKERGIFAFDMGSG